MSLLNIPQHRRSGTYSPTFVSVTNLDSTPVQVAPFTFSIVGDGTVHVAGSVTIDPTAGSLTQARISLPAIAPGAFGSAGDCNGIVASDTDSGQVVADTTNNDAELNIITPDGVADVVAVEFSYAA